MWAICGSVGFAPPWPNAAPLSKQSAAIAVFNLARMEHLPCARAETLD
jgi:hypothetical protein